MWGAGGAGTGIGNMANLNLDTAMLYPGGSGAYVSCAIDAPNGVNLYLLVGQGGRVAGYGSSTTTAIGGGGYGTTQNTYWSPAGGGGRSAVQFSSGVDAIVAGGGGGGGAARASDLGSNGPLSGGGGGGLVGQDGLGFKHGYGGTATAGGACGEGGNSNGALGTGGNGNTASYGSGGGGGYYGGGGAGFRDSYLSAGGGGSSYIGRCSAISPITYYPGVTGTTNTVTLPGGSTANGYISGVGVGSISTMGTMQSPGGNGAIMVTVSRIIAPSPGPTASVPFFSLPGSYRWFRQWFSCITFLSLCERSLTKIYLF